jgi:hypothetical protein
MSLLAANCEGPAALDLEPVIRPRTTVTAEDIEGLF